MSRRVAPRCACCFDTVAYDGPSVLRIDIVEVRCAVTLRWCMTCAATDPLNAQLAEAEAEAVVEGADRGPLERADRDPLQDAYLAILDRAAAHDVAFLPAVADVRRDIDEVRPHGERVTLRAPGSSWGRPTAVPMRGLKTWRMG